MSKRTCLPVIVLIGSALLAACKSSHTQTSDPLFDAVVAAPAFRGHGPRVLFDDGHRNFHRSDGRYAPFVTLLRNDGCVVTPNTKAFDLAALEPYDVLVIVNAEGDTTGAPAFTAGEVEAVGAWVEGGGSLLLVADHSPFGRAANALSERFGVSMLDAHLKDETHHDPGLPGPFFLLFTRENGLLGDHPITRGLSRVVTLIIGEAAALTAQVITGDAAKPFGVKELRFGMSREDIDNKQFALNIVRWLAGAL